MTAEPAFSSARLALDAEAEVQRICRTLKEVAVDFKRRGLVVAMSGGIDSSVTAALSVRALGKERVLGLLMPERDSAPETLSLSRRVADLLGIEIIHEDITPILDAAGCYRRRDDAIREIFPNYGPEHRAKIVLPSVVDSDRFRVFSLVVEAPDGSVASKRLSLSAYLGMVAATNFKQRVRKMLEYYHADRLNYAVTGTPNRVEYDQGFFVKLGDGAGDVKPIAHLYKTQVYQLAEYLEVPEEVRTRPPTTDTYSMPQSQDEFYFSLPYDKMDLCLYGKSHGIPDDDVASAVGISTEQLQRVYRDIAQKRRTTRYLHAPPVLVQKIPEVHVE